MENIFEIIEKNREDIGNIDRAVKETQARIDEKNPELNAVIWQDEQFLNKEINRVKELPKTSALYGLPILVKELDGSIKGTPSTWGNKILKEQNYKEEFTSTMIRLLQEAGAIVVGKTNSPEMGIDVVTDSYAFGPTMNPHNTKQNAGGSSGGSGAAVGSGMVRIATASDGGGSARIPAAICGAWGYKSSNGRISQGPMIGHAWAGLAVKGLIGATASEIAYVCDQISAPQPGDPYNSHPSTTDFFELMKKEIPKLKIGIRMETIGNYVSASKPFKDATNKLADFLTDAGHEVLISSPSVFNETWLAEYFEKIIASNTAADFGEMFKRTKGQVKIEDCCPSVQYFYEMSKSVSAADYIDATYAMEAFNRKSSHFFENFDLLLTPTIADFGTENYQIPLDGPPKFNPYTYAGFTSPINFIGGCAIAIPVKDESSTLPLSVQIASKRDNDQLLFALAHYIECNYQNIYSIP